MTTDGDHQQTTSRTAAWTAPGPGAWVNDPSHATKGPSPLYRRIASRYTKPVYAEVFEDLGVPLGSIDMQFVNGSLYRRLVPLIAPDKDKGTVPPNAVLWLVTRLLPVMRHRERQALRVVTEREFMDDVDRWNETERVDWIAINQELQAVDPSTLDDAGLAEHLADLDQRLIAGWHQHHKLHSSDLGPIGDLLVHADDWNLDLVAVMRLLKGASPATVEAARHGDAIANALRAAGVDPATISDRSEIEAVPEAAAALDDYLGLFGWRLVSDYDIAGLTLNELPSAIVSIVARSGQSEADDSSMADEIAVSRQALRAKAADPKLFDQLLADARQAYGVRDDNGPLTWSWPAGLTRRAFLEAGRRLEAAGAISTADHVFEADLDEVRALLSGPTVAATAAPTAAELEERAAHRRWEKSLQPPATLGPVAPDPDLSAFPPGLKRLMRIILAAITMLDTKVVAEGEEAPALSGLGIGTEPYRGVARVAHDAGEAMAALQPGDILVAPYTTPSFNAVFAIAGGVVVQEGGLLCHAAVMARELGIPAIIGCRDAMTGVNDGDHIELDPGSGLVRVLEPT